MSSSQEEYELIFQMEPNTFGIAPHSLAEAVNTIAETDDIVKLAKPGDYYQIMINIGRGESLVSIGHSRRSYQLIIQDFKFTIHYLIRHLKQYLQGMYQV